MRLHRIVRQVLFILGFVPMVLGTGPWYITILLPLALIVRHGVNEVIIAGRERVDAGGRLAPSMSVIEHDYRE